MTKLKTKAEMVAAIRALRDLPDVVPTVNYIADMVERELAPTMRDIGQKGGRVSASRPGFLADIGRKGGLANAGKGREYFVEMGRKGGAALKASHGHDHFVELGRKGGAAAVAANPDLADRMHAGKLKAARGRTGQS